MSYRSLWVSDIHINNQLPFAKRLPAGAAPHLPGPATDRLLDTLAVLETVQGYAVANCITDVWIPGDLLDRRLIDAVTFHATVIKLRALVDAGLQVRLIPGNHEAFDQSASTYTLTGFGHMGSGIEVWDESSALEVEGWRFRCVPYKPDEEARAAIARIAAEETGDTPVCLVLHQSLVGGKMGGGYPSDHGITPEDLEPFAAIISGHFHTPQWVGKAMYLGAPLQHTFGDAGEQRGFWDIQFNATNWTPIMVGGGAPNFHVAEWDHDASRINIVSGPLTVEPGDYVQINLAGTDAQIKEARPAVETAKTDLLGLGVRHVKINPQPAPTAKTRARVAEERTGKVTWPKAIAGYLDVCDLSGLNRTKLLTIAREAMEEAEA